MAHGDAREGKWRENWRMELVASTLHTTSEHGVSSITTAEAHTSADSSRMNWRPRRFKWDHPFCWKTKSGFCACIITFQTQSTYHHKIRNVTSLFVTSILLRLSFKFKFELLLLKYKAFLNAFILQIFDKIWSYLLIWTWTNITQNQHFVGSLIVRNLREWSEIFSACTIDGNTIDKNFFPLCWYISHEHLCEICKSFYWVRGLEL
jgi:hypothetical protein